GLPEEVERILGIFEKGSSTICNFFTVRRFIEQSRCFVVKPCTIFKDPLDKFTGAFLISLIYSQRAAYVL
ncbi:hypothetical protein, partial [Thalassotalea algicola]|uniref:hypothetical protein n=1 Tax=Thalassotalea algicola TaxID=2716224 RepID=UPI001B7D74CE